jgi:hypothetical protein
LTLAHRAAIIAGGDPTDARAGYPLGILAMLGHLADPGVDAKEAEEQTYLRHQAGLRYAGYRMGAWAGSDRPNPSPRSHLASFALATMGDETFLNLDEIDDLDARQRRCEMREREARAHVLVYGQYPMFVLEDVVCDEHRMHFMDKPGGRLTAAERFTLAALRQALNVLVHDYKPDRREKRGGMRLVPTVI